MILVFANEQLPQSLTKSLFLAGPSPRHVGEPDWRDEALSILTELDYNGHVFIPIPRQRFYKESGDASGWTYDGQVSWECEARQRADKLVFWVPRVIDRTKEDLGMPGFTTNFEMGEDLASGKLAYGRPVGAQKCTYPDSRVSAKGLVVHETLGALLSSVVQDLGAGALRSEGECHVPLFVWKTPSFQAWYQQQVKVGNRLVSASLLSSIVFGGKFLFSYNLKVAVWVAAESRIKDNEFFFSRPDVSSVAAFYRDDEGETHLALVREFRSTVNNSEGFVFELAGGSSLKPGIAPEVTAQAELGEELGIVVKDLSRFIDVSQRQLLSTVSIHQARLFAIALTTEEFAQLCRQAKSGTALGVEGESERTYVTLTTLDQLFALPVDYATLGMIFEAVRTVYR
jgi:8-oxo-dGTP pyrophosphatase MutT (NUDIX family)